MDDHNNVFLVLMCLGLAAGLKEDDPASLKENTKQFTEQLGFVEQEPPETPEVIALGLPSWASLLIYPIDVTFSCYGKPFGYYADPNNECKIYHVCRPVADNTGNVMRYLRYSFVCPNQTMFDQHYLVCTYPHQAVPCSNISDYLYVNENFGKQDPKPELPMTITQSGNVSSSQLIPDIAGNYEAIAANTLPIEPTPPACISSPSDDSPIPCRFPLPKHSFFCKFLSEITIECIFKQTTTTTSTVQATSGSVKSAQPFIPAETVPSSTPIQTSYHSSAYNFTQFGEGSFYCKYIETKLTSFTCSRQEEESLPDKEDKSVQPQLICRFISDPYFTIICTLLGPFSVPVNSNTSSLLPTSPDAEFHIAVSELGTIVKGPDPVDPVLDSVKSVSVPGLMPVPIPLDADILSPTPRITVPVKNTADKNAITADQNSTVIDPHFTVLVQNISAPIFNPTVPVSNPPKYGSGLISETSFSSSNPEDIVLGPVFPNLSQYGSSLSIKEPERKLFDSTASTTVLTPGQSSLASNTVNSAKTSVISATSFVAPIKDMASQYPTSVVSVEGLVDQPLNYLSKVKTSPSLASDPIISSKDTESPDTTLVASVQDPINTSINTAVPIKVLVDQTFGSDDIVRDSVNIALNHNVSLQDSISSTSSPITSVQSFFNPDITPVAQVKGSGHQTFGSSSIVKDSINLALDSAFPLKDLVNPLQSFVVSDEGPFNPPIGTISPFKELINDTSNNFYTIKGLVHSDLSSVAPTRELDSLGLNSGSPFEDSVFPNTSSIPIGKDSAVLDTNPVTLIKVSVNPASRLVSSNKTVDSPVSSFDDQIKSIFTPSSIPVTVNKDSVSETPSIISSDKESSNSFLGLVVPPRNAVTHDSHPVVSTKAKDSFRLHDKIPFNPAIGSISPVKESINPTLNHFSAMEGLVQSNVSSITLTKELARIALKYGAPVDDSVFPVPSSIITGKDSVILNTDPFTLMKISVNSASGFDSSVKTLDSPVSSSDDEIKSIFTPSSNPVTMIKDSVSETPSIIASAKESSSSSLDTPHKYSVSHASRPFASVKGSFHPFESSVSATKGSGVYAPSLLVTDEIPFSPTTEFVAPNKPLVNSSSLHFVSILDSNSQSSDSITSVQSSISSASDSLTSVEIIENPPRKRVFFPNTGLYSPAAKDSFRPIQGFISSGGRLVDAPVVPVASVESVYRPDQGHTSSVKGFFTPAQEHTRLVKGFLRPAQNHPTAFKGIFKPTQNHPAPVKEFFRQTQEYATPVKDLISPASSPVSSIKDFFISPTSLVSPTESSVTPIQTSVDSDKFLANKDVVSASSIKGLFTRSKGSITLTNNIFVPAAKPTTPVKDTFIPTRWHVDSLKDSFRPSQGYAESFKSLLRLTQGHVDSFKGSFKPIHQRHADSFRPNQGYAESFLDLHRPTQGHINSFKGSFRPNHGHLDSLKYSFWSSQNYDDSNKGLFNSDLYPTYPVKKSVINNPSSHLPVKGSAKDTLYQVALVGDQTSLNTNLEDRIIRYFMPYPALRFAKINTFPHVYDKFNPLAQCI
ncbi:uncharacterized protein LOC143249205 [Tachypleus tridentatus]|uniref:uncharacterized protein LOC143249205 n=1 Tax=Tachypleus tridentatus TaxID=6853 RepID=UPI003FCF7157